MIDFKRLNPTAESILKIVEDRPANPENLVFVLRCDKSEIGENIRYLLRNNYLRNTNDAHPDGVYASDEYRITVEGRNYLAGLNFMQVHDKRQFVINVINASVSLIALVKAFWQEISGLWMLLTQ